MTTIGHFSESEPAEPGLVRIPAGMPRSHLLPRVVDTLGAVDYMTCVVDGTRYQYANGVLTFLSPGGARVEVALLVDRVLVEVNDIVVAADITHPAEVEHERLRETLESAFRVLNGLAAVVDHQREDERRAAEEAVQRALDSL